MLVGAINASTATSATAQQVIGQCRDQRTRQDEGAYKDVDNIDVFMFPVFPIRVGYRKRRSPVAGTFQWLQPYKIIVMRRCRRASPPTQV
jgi:hypothetical protein